MTPSLFADEKGVGAKTVVLLHGFGGCHAVWNEVISALSGTARLLAYDLPGHGGSLGFPGAGSAKLAARAVLADLADRGIDEAHVVGHSMGGAVAVLMALFAPGQVASLTLLAPGGFGEAINGPLLRRYAAAVDEAEIRDCLEAMSGPQSTISERILDPYLAMRGRPGQKDKLVEIAAAITKDDRQGVIPRDLLATLTMHVEVLWGTDDTVLPVTQAQGLPPRFHLRRVPGAGHMLVGEAAGLVLDMICESLRSGRRAG